MKLNDALSAGKVKKMKTVEEPMRPCDHKRNVEKTTSAGLQSTCMYNNVSASATVWSFDAHVCSSN